MTNDIYPEEQDGEVLNDALHKRCADTEDKLGITIEYTVYEDRGKLITDLKNAISAGESA